MLHTLRNTHGGWQGVWGVTMSMDYGLRLPDFKFSSCHLPEEKAMAPDYSTLAWKIPWAEEPGRLQSMGSLRVGHD